MGNLDKLQALLEARGAEHVLRLGDDLLWEGAAGNYLATGTDQFGDEVLVVFDLTPEQVTMATLGAEGCPMAACGAMRCDGTACGGHAGHSQPTTTETEYE